MPNAVTSNTGTVVSPVVTFNKSRLQKSVFVYVDYDVGNGTSVTLKLASVNKYIHATNAYEHSTFATATIAPITATFNATGKYRFEIPICPADTIIVATFSFTGGTTQIVVCDLYPN